MKHLVIQQKCIQEGGLRESVSSATIKHLYDAATDPNLVYQSIDQNSKSTDIKGDLAVDRTYESYVEYLTSKYPQLSIVADKYYINFADSYLELLLATAYADGVGVTLTDAALVNSNTTTFKNLFSGNTNITSFNEFRYFVGATILMYDTFKNCTNLESIDLQNITRIGDTAFNGCSKLTTILNYLNILYGLNVFDNCDLTGDFDFSSCSQQSANDIFCGFRNNSHITSIKLPIGCTRIGGFSNCVALLSILNTDDVIYCPFDCFSGCSLLQSISFPELTSTPSAFLKGCVSLQSVDLPKVQTLGLQSFNGCTSLTTINLPSFVGSGSSDLMLFANCTLLSVTFGTDTASFGHRFFTDATIQSLTILADTPPTIVELTFFRSTIGTIYVPVNSVSAYRSAVYWSLLASIIQAVPSS